MVRRPHARRLGGLSCSIVSYDLGSEIIGDLVRSAWLIEASREAVYLAWSATENRWAESAARARSRAALVKTELDARNLKPDQGLIGAHAEWIASLAGQTPDEVPFGSIFAARVGDWVDAHVGPFLSAGADELTDLGRQERATLGFPDSLPPAPEFEPLEVPTVEPPGEVLFRFAILADLHFGSAHALSRARAAIADINASGAELVIQLGDLADHGERKEFERAKSTLATLEMPTHVVMGNHDVYGISNDELSGRTLFEEFFGRPPDGALIEHKGFRFALLDSVEHGISPFPPFNMVTGEFFEGSGGAIVRGALSVPQHDLLAELAAPGSPPVFVFLHHPPQPFTAFPPVLFGLRDADSGRLHAVCDSGNVWGVFAGHTHRNARTRLFGDVPVHEVGIARDYPFGYALVDVTKTGYSYRFVQLSDEELLRDAYSNAGIIHRRYGRGDDIALSFAWSR